MANPSRMRIGIGLAIMLVLAIAVVALYPAGETPDEPWERAWLDDSYSERALAWVQDHSGATLDRLQAHPRFAEYRREAEAVLTDPGRLPEARAIGDAMYGYWQDAGRPLGVWRRAPRETWLSGEPRWQTVLDLDAMSAADGRKWIFAGADCRGSRCLVSMSDNGKDAHVTREFDLDARAFVDGGFSLPESKSSAWWYDDDTLLVASGADGGKVTESELPATIRLWRRGESLASAPVLFSIGDGDAGIGASLVRACGVDGFVGVRRPTFFRREHFRVTVDGERLALPLPERMAIRGLHGDRLMIRLNEDWTPPGTENALSSGTLIALSLCDLLDDRRITNVETLYRPRENEAVRTVVADGDTLYVELLRSYRSAVLRLSPAAGGWRAETLPLAADRFISLLDVVNGRLLLRVEGILTPERLVSFDPADGSEQTLYARPPAFATDNLVATLKYTESRDGTRIAYTIVHDRDMPADGRNPTLIYGYGGFDVAITPRYEPLFGKLWLEKGGVYVHAYLRGGGENGPDWHRSAMLRNRQQPYDDMIAIIEALQDDDVTSPAHTGIMGRSNGGLMVASVMTQRPDLMNAVVVGGPLTDMLTYHLIPPGASWTAEYGDPRDAGMHDFIAGYSPLQQLDSNANYPAPLVITSTDDDRVLPGHARRFVAELESLGHDSYYFEDAQGGHYWELAGGPAPGDWRLRAIARAVEFSYLAERLTNAPQTAQTAAATGVR